MKDHKVTAIYANEISNVCSTIESMIESECSMIEHYRERLVNEPEEEYYKDQIDLIKEKINALEWCIKQLTIPFKLKN